MSSKKMGQMDIKDLWTIPNLITYFRILCIPAFVTLMAYAGINNNSTLLYIALGVFSVAAGSDLVDGWIARKFNMQSGIGMVLDPLADKLMHISVLLSLCLCTGLTPLGQSNAASSGGWYVHYAFVIVIMLKELIMLCAGPFVVKKGAKVKANMMGKVASAFISGGVFLAFFHPFVYYVDWAVLGLGAFLSVCAGLNYLYDIAIQVKKINSGEQEVASADSVKSEDMKIVEEKRSKHNNDEN